MRRATRKAMSERCRPVSSCSVQGDYRSWWFCCLDAQDKYIISIMVMIFSVCVWHALIGGLIHQLYVDKVLVAATTTPAPKTTTLSPPADNNADYGPNVTWPIVKVNPTTKTTAAAYDPYAFRASDLSYPASPKTKLADQVALACLASVFLLIHVIFFTAGALSVRQDIYTFTI